MFVANLVENFTRRADAAVRNIVQTLADAFFRICVVSDWTSLSNLLIGLTMFVQPREMATGYQAYFKGGDRNPSVRIVMSWARGADLQGGRVAKQLSQRHL